MSFFRRVTRIFAATNPIVVATAVAASGAVAAKAYVDYRTAAKDKVVTTSKPLCSQQPEVLGCIQDTKATAVPAASQQYAKRPSCSEQPEVLGCIQDMKATEVVDQNAKQQVDNASCVISEGTALIIAESDSYRQKLATLQSGYSGANVTCTNSRIGTRVRNSFPEEKMAMQLCRSDLNAEQKLLKTLKDKYFSILNAIQNNRNEIYGSRDTACDALVSQVTGVAAPAVKAREIATTEDPKQITGGRKAELDGVQVAN